MTYDLDTAGVSDLFKTVYGKLAEATFNTSFPALSQIKMEDMGFGGLNKQFPQPLTFGGSVGAGTLPTANRAEWGTVTLTRKKVYARLLVDRETIYAAKDDKAAFIRGTKEYVRKAVESYTRNTNRILFGDGGETGAPADGGRLGTIASVINADPVFTLTMDSSFKAANFEERDYVNVEAGSDVFEVTSVDPALKEVVITRIGAGAQVPAATEDVYMQNSRGNEPTGLKAVCDATAGSLYGIPIQRRWQAEQKAAGGEGIGPDLLNEVILKMNEKNGKNPNLIMMSYVQYRKYLDLLEDQKHYHLRPTDERFQGKVSFTGIQFLSSTGIIPVLPERFIEDDRVYFLNTRFIQMHRAPGFGWFDDDGTVLLRSANDDSYEARYGGYWEFFINPAEQGVITGLAT